MKVLVLVAFSLFIVSVAAFDCYQCEYYENDNSTDSKCYEEPVPESLMTECKLEGSSVNDWQCVKKIGKTIEDEKKYVKRYCSPGKTTYEASCKESDSVDTPYGMAEKGFKCFCDTPGCNGGSTLTIAFTLPLLILAFTGYNAINQV